MIALIFDTVEPYVYETYPLMFFPEGFLYEARFKQRHLDPKFLEKVNCEETRRSLTGESALICLRTKLPKEGSKGELPFRSSDTFFDSLNAEKKKLISPLRVVEIRDIRLVAGVVLVRYRLAQYYNYGVESDLAAVRAARENVNKTMYKCSPLIDGSSKPEENGDIYHLFECDELNQVASEPRSVTLNDDSLRDRDNSVSSNWRTIVSLLHFQPYLETLPFVLYCGLRPQNLPSRFVRFERWLSKTRFGRWFSGVQTSGDHTDHSKITFEANTTYELKVFESYPQEMVRKIDRKSKLPEEHFKHSREYVLELDENFFSVRRSQQAIGGYDFLEFAIQVRPGRAGSMGSLHLDVSEFLGEKNKFISKQIDLEYQIASGMSSLWGLVGGLFLIVLAIVTTSRWVDNISGAYHLRFGAELLIDMVYVLGVVGVVQYIVTKR